MKTFIFAATAAAASALNASEFQFMSFAAEHNKSYETVEEFQMRAALFAETEAFIQEHNTQNNNYTVGHNQFSDMTDMERKARLGFRAAENKDGNVVELDTTNLPESVDWRTAGAVNAIQDQGQCGSCWAFSATGSLEGAHFLATGNLLKFAEQQLVDCANTAAGYLNFGCNGGMYGRAWNYWKTHDAILESDYAYTAKDGTCAYDSTPLTTIEVTNWSSVKTDDVAQTKAAVAQRPISIAIEADKLVFQQYSSGIFDNTKCGTTMDHAVMLVGYGSENGQDYFILRNSWGTTWGEKGYMRIAAVDGVGICGMNQQPQYTNSD